MATTKRKVSKHGNDRWEVDFGVIQGTGKRLRPVFLTEKAADDAIENHEKTLKKYGDVWLKMSQDERSSVMSVYSEIRAAGLSLRNVWDSYKKDHGEQPVSKSVPYQEAVKELKRRKLGAGKDERYVEELGGLLLRFGEGQLERHIDKISVKELQDWIDAQAWGLSAKKSNYGRFSSLWSMAVDLGWASFNIVDRLEPVGRIPVNVRIWPNDTCLALLAATQSNDAHKKVTATVVLGLFGCMRPEEISHEKMSWDIIDLKHGKVTVPAEIAKTGDQRTYMLQPLAWEWLKRAKAQGSPLPCPNERKIIDSCCEMAGIKDWPHDILRKCCATHLSNVYKNDWSVVRDMGNSVRILLKHYKALLTPEEVSVDYWQITPNAAMKELKRRLKAAAAPLKPTASGNAKPAR